MKLTHLMTLLLCNLILITACQKPNESSDKLLHKNGQPTSNIMNTPTDMNKARMSQAIKHTETGKTDADHLWLETIEGQAALKQVENWNSQTQTQLGASLYKDINNELSTIYNSPEKIAYISHRAGEAYNFWQDENHVKGIWRKTSLDNYINNTPKWETILDFDALSKTENKNWVYKGVNCLEPDYMRCIVNLSDGGKDAVERREFDIQSRQFVDNGFKLGISRGHTTWLDKDRLLASANFGEGTLTDSQYPRQIKLWQRGTPIDESRLIFEAKPTDVAVWSMILKTPDDRPEIIIENSLTFFTSAYFWIPQNGPNAFKAIQLPLPSKSNINTQYKDEVIIYIHENWRGYKSGSVLSFSFSEFIKTGEIKTLKKVFSPNDLQSLEQINVTKNGLLLSINNNVVSEIYAYKFNDENWQKTKLAFPENGELSIKSTHKSSDIAFIASQSFLEPDTLWQIKIAEQNNHKAQSNRKVQSLSAWFDSSTMISEQAHAISTDGTSIPYFIIRDKNIKLDGTNPTILYGYGGFQVSMTPFYSPTIGKAWLERGGVYVLANIRGGGEFGPDWHQAGLKTKRQIIYDDFIAIAEDLIAKNITTPRHLGIHGGSNGGLLMGVMMTQRPDLFNAIAIGVPLLDMHRYHKLLAGASWVDEYGNPDDEGAEGEFIRNLSPYHNIVPNREYPEPFIYTSTKDDRVHPAHARKFAQRLQDHGYEFYYYENIDGGHSAAANLNEAAHKNALIYNYFHKKLQ